LAGGPACVTALHELPTRNSSHCIAAGTEFGPAATFVNQVTALVRVVSSLRFHSSARAVGAQTQAIRREKMEALR